MTNFPLQITLRYGTPWNYVARNSRHTAGLRSVASDLVNNFVPVVKISRSLQQCIRSRFRASTPSRTKYTVLRTTSSHNSPHGPKKRNGNSSVTLLPCTQCTRLGSLLSSVCTPYFFCRRTMCLRLERTTDDQPSRETGRSAARSQPRGMALVSCRLRQDLETCKPCSRPFSRAPGRTRHSQKVHPKAAS